MITTKLNLQDKLPLTCSRTGTCCHGKNVQLNPWELMSLAKEKKITPKAFRDQYCDFGGIRLRFNGSKGWKEYQACSQYIENFGCSVHLGRPLSCRLYPLGRQKKNNEIQYIYQDNVFPCLEGCPEVTSLPFLSVNEYLSGQSTEKYEIAQDAYLEMMQNIADIAFELYLETGLAESGDQETLQKWRTLGNDSPEIVAEKIGSKWMDRLMLPSISEYKENPVEFTQKHNEMLFSKIQEEFGHIETFQEIQNASVLMMALALHLGRSVGADTAALAEHWIAIAKNLGEFEE